MRTFNLAEELEKERKKNKKLEEEINKLTAESTHYESKYYNEAKKVDKAIEYCNKLEKENKKIIEFEIRHDEYQHIEAETQNELIYDLLKILKGE